MARPLIGEGLVTRGLRVVARDVVFVKGLIEALEGIAIVFAEKGGDLVIAAPISREKELDSLIDDLCREVGAMKITLLETPPPGPDSA
ncbi:MAG: hypothetical protein ABI461_09115 [Polyangiaceae bacterium]